MHRLGLFALLGGCDGGKDSAGAAEADADTDSDADSDTDTDVTCVALAEGVWSMNGSCFGMPMYATLTLGDDGCTFAFTKWSMAMESPGGGSVDGKTVTLSGLDGWDTCTGPATGKTFEGTCPDRAFCAFEMWR